MISIHSHEKQMKCYNNAMPIKGHIATLLTVVAAVVLARTATMPQFLMR